MDAIKPDIIQPGDALLNSRVAGLRTDAARSDALREVSEEFEALLVNFMMRSMRATIPHSGLLPRGMGVEFMESLFDQELSLQVAARSRLGIAEMIQAQLEGSGSFRGDVRHAPLQLPPPVRQVEPAPLPASGQRIPGLEPFEGYIESAAGETGMDSDLIRAVILAESNGNRHALSPKGAKGLMQLMDATAREMGITDSWDPRQNITGGTRYLEHLSRRFDGNLELMLAAYNAGPGAVQRHGGIPPFAETRAYIRRIQGILEQYRP